MVIMLWGKRLWSKGRDVWTHLDNGVLLPISENVSVPIIYSEHTLYPMMMIKCEIISEDKIMFNEFCWIFLVILNKVVFFKNNFFLSKTSNSW